MRWGRDIFASCLVGISLCVQSDHFAAIESPNPSYFERMQFSGEYQSVNRDQVQTQKFGDIGHRHNFRGISRRTPLLRCQIRRPRRVLVAFDLFGDHALLKARLVNPLGVGVAGQFGLRFASAKATTSLRLKRQTRPTLIG